MSRWWDSSEDMERRIWRAVVVSEYTDVSVAEYIRRAKARDRRQT